MAKSKKNTSKKEIPSINGKNVISGTANGVPAGPQNPMIPQATPHQSSGVSFFKNPLGFIHDHVQFLNSSKFFAGIVMILLNVGSKFISIQFSKSTEEYLKFSLSKQLLVFSMAWMGTRDIYVALGLTAVFVVLSDHLFNEESKFCIVPHKYRVLHKLVDENNDGSISDTEVNNAVAILEKAKKNKEKKYQKETYAKYFNYDMINNSQ
jgi:hypothetical protein